MLPGIIPESPKRAERNTMSYSSQALDHTLAYFDELLPDGAMPEQFECWLDLILGEIEVEYARD